MVAQPDNDTGPMFARRISSLANGNIMKEKMDVSFIIGLFSDHTSI
jgi:hypothetical protein